MLKSLLKKGTPLDDKTLSSRKCVTFAEQDEVREIPENNFENIFDASAEDLDGLDDKEEMWFPVGQNFKNFEKHEYEVRHEEEMWDSLKIGTQLTWEEKTSLLSLLKWYKGVFPTSDFKLGSCTLPSAVHAIDTGDHPPICQPLRYHGPWKQLEIERQVLEMLDMGVISRSDSEWSSNIVLVAKKAIDNGPKTMRMTIDYRDVNAITKKCVYPMPNIQALLDCLHGSEIYSSLDLFNGYWNLHIKEGDKVKTAFRVAGPQGGVFQFERLPFGLQGAPGTFSKVVNEIFHDVTGVYVLPYLDDFTVYSKNFAEHLVHLEDVLKRVEDVGLKVKPSKCCFAKTKITFLGFDVSKNGIEPGKDKLKAVEQFKTPATVKQVKGFLGLAGFYRRFVPNFASVADPLTRLTVKDTPFVWGEAQENAFRELQKRLLNYPVLVHYNTEASVEIHTDASTVGLGAVLMQWHEGILRVIAYASRSLNKAERNYGATHLELLAVVFGVEKFEPYIAGNQYFKIVSDCSAIGPLLRTKNPVGRLSRWIMRLTPFNFEVVHKKGCDNVIPDYLSRYPVEECEEPVSHPVAPLFYLPKINIERAQRDDSFCKGLIEILEGTTDSRKFREKILFYILKNKVLYRRVECDGHQRLLMVVPKSLQLGIIREAHDTLQGGHLGISRTYERIRARYFWPGCLQQVASFCATCESCQRKKSPGGRPKGYLQPLPVTGPFEKIHLDFAGPLPLTKKRNMHLLLAVEPLTKYIIARAVPAVTSAQVAHFLVERVFLVHGCAKEVVSDRGTAFTGTLSQQIFKLFGVRHITCTAGHHASDGIAERAIQTFKEILSHFVNETQKNWDTLVAPIEWVMNTAKNETTGYTPFQLVFGRDPLQPLDLALSYEGGENVDSLSEYAESVRDWLDHAREIAKIKVNETHQKEAPRFNFKRDEASYNADDLVLLWKPLHVEGLHNKLVKKWCGPFKILRKINEVNYEILHISGKGKPDVVHVERLKPYQERDVTESDIEITELETETPPEEPESLVQQLFPENKEEGVPYEKGPSKAPQKPPAMQIEDETVEVQSNLVAEKDLISFDEEEVWERPRRSIRRPVRFRD